MDKLSKLVLFWVSNDYETVNTIQENISEDFGSDLSPDKINDVLNSLYQKELVGCFEYDKANGRFIIKNDATSLSEDTWWLVTDKGKEVLMNK